MSKFKKFVDKPLDGLLETRHYMAQYGTLVGKESKFPLPRNVLNVLNAITTGHRAHVAKSMFTSALAHATRRRAELADYVTLYLKKKYGEDYLAQKYGHNFEVGQDAVFSKKAYQEIPELGQIADKIADWWDRIGGEPDSLEIGNNKSYDLQDINAELANRGRDILRFGGTDGLMEYIEDGDWRKTGGHTQLQPDSKFDKQGHDLAVPTVKVNIDELAKKGYTFEDNPATTSKQTIKAVSPDHPKKILFRKNVREKDGSVSSVWMERGSPKKRMPDKRIVYAFGTSDQQGGFFPPQGASRWGQVIKQSVADSNQQINKIIEDLKSGKELNDANISFLNQLVKNGELNKDAILEKEVALGQLLNIKNEAGTTHIENPEQYATVKAATKIWIDHLLQSPPQGRGGGGGWAPHDEYGGYPRITVGDTQMDLASLNNELRDYAVSSTAREKLTNIFLSKLFDDEAQTVHNRVIVRRLPPGETKNENFKFNIRQAVSSQANTKIANSLEALSKAGKNIEIEINGEKKQFEPNDISKRLSAIAVLAQPKDLKMGAKKAIEQKPVDIASMEEEGWEFSKHPYGPDVEEFTAAEKGTGRKKKLVRKTEKGGWKFYELKPTEGEIIKDVSKYQHKMLAANFALLTDEKAKNKKDRFILAKRKIVQDPDNPDKQIAVWQRVKSGKEAKLSNPLLQMQLNPNAGMKQRLTYSPDERNEKYGEFLNNLEKYGEKTMTWQGQEMPLSVYMAINELGQAAKAKGIPTEELTGAAEFEGLVMNLGNYAFKYGDFNLRPGIKDIDTILAKHVKDIKPDEIEPLRNDLRRIIADERKSIKPHMGGELIQTNDKGQTTVREDVYDALIKNGFEWRRRRAKSAAGRWLENWVKGSHRGTGEGGKGSEEESWQSILAAGDPDADIENVHDDEDEDGGEDDYWSNDDDDIRKNTSLFSFDEPEEFADLSKIDSDGEEIQQTNNIGQTINKGSKRTSVDATSIGHNYRNFRNLDQPVFDPIAQASQAPQTTPGVAIRSSDNPAPKVDRLSYLQPKTAVQATPPKDSRKASSKLSYLHGLGESRKGFITFNEWVKKNAR